MKLTLSDLADTENIAKGNAIDFAIDTVVEENFGAHLDQVERETLKAHARALMQRVEATPEWVLQAARDMVLNGE
jgi:citrate lyase gamma subunit